MLRPGTLSSLLTRLAADSLRHAPPAQSASGASWQLERIGGKTGFVGYHRVPAFLRSGWHRPSPSRGPPERAPVAVGWHVAGTRPGCMARTDNHAPAAPAPRLLDRVRLAMRARHYSPRTEDTYVGWIRRFIFFHDRRHPDTLGADDVNRFLTHLAVDAHVSASTQNLACSAILFLYGEGLRRRHPFDDTGLQRAFKIAVRHACLTKPASCHSLRHSFATHLL